MLIIHAKAVERAEDPRASEGNLAWDSLPTHFKNTAMNKIIIEVGSVEEAPFQVHEACKELCDSFCSKIPRHIINHGTHELLYGRQGEFHQGRSYHI